jgi:hypothetical protein
MGNGKCGFLEVMAPRKPGGNDMIRVGERALIVMDIQLPRWGPRDTNTYANFKNI